MRGAPAQRQQPPCPRPHAKNAADKGLAAAAAAAAGGGLVGRLLADPAMQPAEIAASQPGHIVLSLVRP